MMKSGAVAIFDCLGFKGIWKKEDTSALVDKLLRTEDEVLLNLPPGESPGIPTNTTVRLLSDTVVISVLAREDLESADPFTIGQVLSQAYRATARVLWLFLKSPPLLTMRGCITYGEHLVTRNFLLGPAVDTAAEFMNHGDGAFVWLHPDAAAIYKAHNAALQARFGTGYPGVIDDYEMPLKGGDRLRCPVVNPFPSVESHHDILDSYLAAFDHIKGESLEIQTKYHNTLEFFVAADEAWLENERFWVKRIGPPEILRESDTDPTTD